MESGKLVASAKALCVMAVLLLLSAAQLVKAAENDQWFCNVNYHVSTNALGRPALVENSYKPPRSAFTVNAKTGLMSGSIFHNTDVIEVEIIQDNMAAYEVRYKPGPIKGFILLKLNKGSPTEGWFELHGTRMLYGGSCSLAK